MNLKKKIGIDYGDQNHTVSLDDRIKYINFKLASLGLPGYRPENAAADEGEYFVDLFEDIIRDYQEKTRMVNIHDIGINRRINRFFNSYFNVSQDVIHVIDRTFALDYYGLARVLSLPPNRDEYFNEYISSYRIKQGVLNNPKNDKRTTKGSFHIVEGGLAIPNDKKAVPKGTFLKMYRVAVNPPEELLELPFTAEQKEKAKTFVSLLIKPVVSPEVPGVLGEKTMEILLTVPGSMVSTLDFVESVFGNAGDPGLHINDSGLDIDGWSGHTGHIILAPHLTRLRKVDLGLPHKSAASQRQIRDGMCYENEDELYNEGQAFKLTCRDKSGVVVTLIADNYFGYSKKEVKTQISFAANLMGNAEEEHAGGTVVFPRINLGENYNAVDNGSLKGYSFNEVKRLLGSALDVFPENYGVDKRFRNLIYLPENANVDLHRTAVTWEHEGVQRGIKLLPSNVYILPNGDKIHMERHPAAPAWKLVGTEAEGTFCHKPCTVSGGGKSEISKLLSNSIIYGYYYVHDLEKDLNHVEEVLNYDYSRRWKEEPDRLRPSRPLLSVERTLGSVIKLLTPSAAYTDDFNGFLDSIPNHVKALVFMVKRFYQASWNGDWRSHFSVDIINGRPGHEVKYDDRKIRPSYLRVGFEEDHSWRVFKLRMDFMPSEKLQIEDDITASVLVQADRLKNMNPEYSNPAYKFSKNCEYRFFQRPDEAIFKGYDRQAEKDLSGDNLFATNFEPLDKAGVQAIREDVMEYIAYTEPVREHIEAFMKGNDKYCVISSEPRIVDGKPTKNPRYLETRSDFLNPLKNYIAEIGTRLSRRIPLDLPVYQPVNSVLAGRRNNPPSLEDGKKILPLSVYNPVHYQELPELFMDLISSLTGKSPSTTGAGSEGALTKGPFNMLLPIYDLNSALLSYALGGYSVFTTPAGHIGPHVRVDHDISLLVPEIWARLSEEERNPSNMLALGALEKIEDFEYEGKCVPASRLGYRITDVFLYRYLGKIFDEPQTVFHQGILKPERQDMAAFVDGVLNIASGHKKSALAYFEDGGIDAAIPPLKALLHIMAYGSYEGQDIQSPAIRSLFERETIIHSPWYAKRLANKQKHDAQRAKAIVSNLAAFVDNKVNHSVVKAFGYDERLIKAKEHLHSVESEAYLKSLWGTPGAEEI